jgi:hypothetical protein
MTAATATGISYVDKLDGRAPRHVVIVYPFTYINPHLAIPPLAAEYLQVGVLAAGRTSTLLDMRYEKDISEHLRRADVVCLYGFFEDCAIFGKWHLHVIDEVIDAVPAGTPIVVGGTGFSDPEQALRQHPKVDIVIRGVPDVPIEELLRRGSPEEVANLHYRQDGRVVKSPRVVHALDRFPDRSLRNPKYGYHFMGVGVDLVRAAIGCDYKCRFCYQYGKDTDGNYLRWKGRSPESQFAEMKTIDAPFVFWVDDDMTNDMETMEKFCDLMIANGVKKAMVGTGRVDHTINSRVEVLKKMERTGFVALAFGVESLRDDTLRFYRKAQKVANVEKAMGMMNQTNILLFCNILLGSPGESEADMMSLLPWARKWHVDTLVTNRLRVPENSDIYNVLYDEHGQVRPGMDRIRGPQLKRIKRALKYGQRSPFRVMLTILKLFRHEGLPLNPLYFTMGMAETFTRHTWLEKTRLVPALTWLPKQIARTRAFDHVTRGIARLLTPPVMGMARFTEAFDERLGFSTQVMPRVFDVIKDKMVDPQREKAQIVTRETVSVGTKERAASTSAA